MSSEKYKLYRKYKVEIFDMIYDIFERAPVPPGYLLFGAETEEEREEFNKKMDEYLKIEEPKIKERFKEIGFEV